LKLHSNVVVAVVAVAVAVVAVVAVVVIFSILELFNSLDMTASYDVKSSKGDTDIVYYLALLRQLLNDFMKDVEKSEYKWV